MERHTKEQSEGKEEEREEETEVEEKEGKAGGCLQSPYYNHCVVRRREKGLRHGHWCGEGGGGAKGEGGAVFPGL